MDGPRQYKYITKEIVKNGSIEIHSTKEDMEKLAEVKEYNYYMKECRSKMNDLRIIRNIYLIANVVVIFTLMLFTFFAEMMFSQGNEIIVKFIISMLLIIAYAVVYFIFSFWRNELEFLPNVLMTVPLLYISWWFLLVLLMDIFFCGYYRYSKGFLGEEMGYPLFYDLKVDRIRGKTYDSQVKVPVYSEIIKKVME